MALTITRAKAGDRIKLTVKSLSYGALHPVIGLTENYLANRRLLQEIINMPVRLFTALEVAV
ncbi:unnamed protein product [marine sediment metagenome]|uniref:Uncharacterized protein n=1 Tax=marine sediment metagenome TaxID=412755 RepID=X1TBS1_9ZZZZ